MPAKPSLRACAKALAGRIPGPKTARDLGSNPGSPTGETSSPCQRVPLYPKRLITRREGMKGFPRFIGKLRDDIQHLHDSLWHEWNGDKDALKSDLREGAANLDAFLGLNGQFSEPVQSLVDEWGKGNAGGALFELLYTTRHFALATELFALDDFEGAARHAANAAENLSIGLCSAADCFHLLAERESGEISFETYADELAKALERRGVDNARVYAQALVTVWNLGMNWDAKASDQTKLLASRSVLATSAYSICHAVMMGASLEPPPPDPYNRLPDIVFHISQRGPI